MGRFDLGRESTVHWYFYQESPGSWRWDVVSGTGELLQNSEQLFATRPDCVRDARAHGCGEYPA